MSENRGTFLRHDPCPECGSSDGVGVYQASDSDRVYGICFVCEAYIKMDDGEDGSSVPSRRPKLSNANFIDGQVKPLTQRGISDVTCSRYGYTIGKNQWGKPVQIANYYAQGQLKAQHTRDAEKNFAWIGDPSGCELFGQHLFRSQGGKRVVVTEGEIDCLTVAQVLGNKWPVVSLPNGAQSAKKFIKANLEFLESYEEVVLCFDNDEPGRKATEECAQLLSPGKAKIVQLPGKFKDPNEMLQQDKVKELVTSLWEAQVYRPDGILLASELTLDDLLTEEDIAAYSLPYPKLDSMMRGIRKGELTLMTAGSGIGKSTLAREIGYHLLEHHKLKVAEVRLEESIKKSALGYIAIDNNVPLGNLFLNRSLLSPEQWQASYAKLIANERLYLYDHFGSLASDNLLSKLRYLAVGCGVDFIVLDHISIVVSGMDLSEDERRAIDQLMTNLRALVENTGVGIIAICHLKQPEKGKAHEEGRQVSLSDLRGSGALKQLSDTVLALERNQQGDEPDLALIRLLKNRLFGDTGVADTLKYHKDTGRLLLADNPVDDFKDETQQPPWEGKGDF